MQADCGATEVQLFGYGYEVTEMAQLDIAIHTLKIIIGMNKILDVWVCGA
jgi:hypothetical protein